MDRNRTLEGLRGCLALMVVVGHVWQTPAQIFLGNVWVWAFFALSGLVLARGWDGRYVSFLARRFVRLWPLYALCLMCGYALAGRPPLWSQLLWWPLMSPNDPTLVDKPAWSLCIEAFAMLAMPLFAFIANRSLTWMLVGLAVCVLAARLDIHFWFGVFFVAGAWAGRFDWRWAPLEHPLAQWLGRISYPLYLSHWIVLHYLGWPMAARIVLAFLIAEALTRTVERWSIDGSRWVGRLRWPRVPERTATR